MKIMITDLNLLLNQYDISIQEHKILTDNFIDLEAFFDLLKLNFSKDKLFSIINKKGASALSIKALQKNYLFFKDFYQPEELIRIVNRRGGHNNLEKVKELWAPLSQHYTSAQILRVASYEGGSKSLESLLQHRAFMEQKLFSSEDIIRVVSFDGGSNNLNSLVENYTFLKDSNLTNLQIIQLAARTGGRKNIASFVSDVNVLMSKKYDNENEQYTLADIIRLLGQTGGHLNLKALIECDEELRALGFNKNQLLKMISQTGGSLNIFKVKEHYNSLAAMNFSAEEIAQLVGHNGGHNNLETIREYMALKDKIMFTKNELLQITMHQGGSANLRAIIQSQEQLIRLKLSPETITKVVSDAGGSKNLNALLYYLQTGLYNFTEEQLIAILRYAGASNVLASIEKHQFELSQLLLSSKDVVKICKTDNSLNKINTIVYYSKRINDLNLSPQQIVSLTSMLGGAVNLAISLYYLEKLKGNSIISQDLMIDYLKREKMGREQLEQLSENGVSLKEFIKNAEIEEIEHNMRMLGVEETMSSSITSYKNEISTLNAQENLKQQTTKKTKRILFDEARFANELPLFSYNKNGRYNTTPFIATILKQEYSSNDLISKWGIKTIKKAPKQEHFHLFIDNLEHYNSFASFLKKENSAPAKNMDDSSDAVEVTETIEVLETGSVALNKYPSTFFSQAPLSHDETTAIDASKKIKTSK